MLPPEKPKIQPSVNFDPKRFQPTILCFGLIMELNTGGRATGFY